ncbi:MAG: hypothetical protein JJE35_07175 [Thermoleophilia bacterium]|nr:hypothetical protein [Thermoleophilia bacterium]
MFLDDPSLIRFTAMLAIGHNDDDVAISYTTGWGLTEATRVCGLTP